MGGLLLIPVGVALFRCENSGELRAKKMAGATSTPAKRSSKRGGERSASGGRDEDGATEYEKQRLSRIRENRERLEALGLPSLASALMGSSGSGKQGLATEEEKAGIWKRRQKKKGRGGDKEDEDDEYQPSEEDEGDGSSSSGEEKTDEEEEGHAFPPGGRQPPREKKQGKEA